MQDLTTYKRQAQTYIPQMNEDGTITVPVVMMLPGVHSGSRGAMLHTAENLRASAAQWNGKPVTIQHPTIMGQFVSATTDGVLHVGIITNTRYEDNKLKADAVLNAASIETADAACYQAILTGQPLDVSVGAFSTEETATGQFNGETYTAITTAYEPDHLALLPGKQGACSWDDGCGIRVNEKVIIKKGETMTTLKEKIQELAEAGIGVFTFQINEESLMAKMEAIRNYVYSMDSEWVSCYVKDVYDTSFVYEKNTRRNGSAIPTKYFKQDYTISPEGQVQVDTDPVQVIMKTEYLPIQTNEKQTKKGENEMTDPCCPQKVEELIVNAASKFTADDRTWLLTLNSEQLEKLIPKEIQVNVSAEHVTKHLSTYKSAEEVLEMLPEAIRTDISSGLALHNEKRTNLINTIQTNAKEVWTAEELALMQTSQLEKISKSMTIGNYAAAPGGKVELPKAGTGIEPMLPAGFEETK